MEDRKGKPQVPLKESVSVPAGKGKKGGEGGRGKRENPPTSAGRASELFFQKKKRKGEPPRREKEREKRGGGGRGPRDRRGASLERPWFLQGGATSDKKKEKKSCRGEPGVRFPPNGRSAFSQVRGKVERIEKGEEKEEGGADVAAAAGQEHLVDAHWLG